MFAIPAGMGTIPASPYAQTVSPADLKDRRQVLTSLVSDATGTVSVDTKAKALSALSLLQFTNALAETRPATPLTTDTIVLSEEATRRLRQSQGDAPAASAAV